jgi:hypothetical protein
MPERMKSVLAVAAGFVAIVVLSLGADMVLRALLPHRFSPDGAAKDAAVLIIALFYSAAFAVLGCYLAACLSPQNPKRHAMILGCIGLLLSIVATIVNWKTAPIWYHIIALLLILPAAWVGGEMRERQLPGQK